MNKWKNKVFISIILFLAIVIWGFLFTEVNFKIHYNAINEDMIQVYYDTNGLQKVAFNEFNCISKELNSGENQILDVKIPLRSINKIRIVFDQINNIVLKELSIDIGGIPIVHLDPQEIQESFMLNDGVEKQLIDNGLLLEVVKSKASISSINVKKVISINNIIILLIIGVLGYFFFNIVYIKKLMIGISKKINIKFIIWCALLIFMMGYSFSESINDINYQTEYTFEEIYKDVDKEDFKGEKIIQPFTPKTNNIKYLILKGKSKDSNNVLEIKIKSSDEVILSDKYQIKDIGIKDGFKIDISNLKLDKNKEYLLEIFSSNEIAFEMYDDQILIKQGFERNNNGIITAFIIILFLITIGCLVGSLVLHLPLYKKFAILSLIFGIILAILLPPLIGADEARHFARAYDITQGEIISRHVTNGDWFTAIMPKNFHELRNIGTIKDYTIHQENYNSNQIILMDNYLELFRDRIDSETDIMSLSATSEYVPIAYIGQLLPIYIMRVLQMPPIIILYAARIGNLIFWILLCTLAIKIVPYYKNLFFMIAFIPTNISLAASCSPDAVINSISMLYIAYILYLRERKINTSVRQKFLLILMLIVIGVIKPPYAILSILLFLIPQQSYKKQILNVLLGIALPLLVYILWSKIQYPLSVELDSSATNTVAQYVHYILSNPLEYIRIIFNEIKDSAFYYARNMFTRLGENKTSDNILAVGNLIMLVSVSLLTASQIKFKLKENIVFIVTIIFLLLSLTLVGFTWNPLEDRKIWPIQGRYFLPIVPLISIYLTNQGVIIPETSIEKYLNIFVIWSMFISCMFYINRYFI